MKNIDVTVTTIETDNLVTVTGGVRPGPNGEGCTGPHCGPRPRPRPTPTFPLPQGPVVDPAPDLGLGR